jgi:sortase A
LAIRTLRDLALSKDERNGENMVETPSVVRETVQTTKSKIILKIAQRILFSLGAILLGFYALARIEGVVTSHAAMLSFEESKANAEGASNAKVDESLWSAVRIKAYNASLKKVTGPPLAVLKIPKVNIVAPVMDGIGDLALNAGVGRIPGTAMPGGPGNVGIAGHRDGFFRGLKDVANGDKIELVTTRKTDVYVVDSVHIVNPADVNVLRSGATPSVTLVTCYPFYFAGSAPKRYIVHASLKEQIGSATK